MPVESNAGRGAAQLSVLWNDEGGMCNLLSREDGKWISPERAAVMFDVGVVVTGGCPGASGKKEDEGSPKTGDESLQTCMLLAPAGICLVI